MVQTSKEVKKNSTQGVKEGQNKTAITSMTVLSVY